MPIEFRVDVAQHAVLARVTGAVSDADLLEYARRTAADPQVRSGMNELIDVRGARTDAVTSEALRTMAAIFAAHDAGPCTGRVAVVASEDAAYGLCRMYQAYREGAPVELRVFRELDEARVWLGLPSGSAAPQSSP